MTLDHALQTGAMALFGEKYGDASASSPSPISARNSAGAPTCSRTGDIGVCKIVYEGSISAGVRRIEAITGEGALHRFQETVESLHRVSSLVGAGGQSDPSPQVVKLLEENESLEKQLEH